MAIDIGRLERELWAMTCEGAPGRDLCLAIAELARTGRFERLRAVLPEVVYGELEERYRADAETFAEDWGQVAAEMHRGFLKHARQRLTQLTRLQPAKESERAPEWMAIQRALDADQNDLLRAALAEEVLGLVEPAVTRARQLRECVVADANSEEADRYLDEATRCFLYGLSTACAVMCRAVLERALRSRLPEELLRLVNGRYRHAATLGNLLHEVNNHPRLAGVDAGFPALAHRVNDAGRRAVHQETVSEEEARQCLWDAREALRLLLRPAAGAGGTT